MTSERRPLPPPTRVSPGLAQHGANSAEIRDIVLALIEEADVFRLRIPPYPGVESLAEKIRRAGQSTPLFVRPREDRFELISGYKRRAALELIGAPTALCRIYRDISDEAAYDIAIEENQERDNLSDLERADICVRLTKEGKTANEIAARMRWKSRRYVQDHLRLAREASAALRDALQTRKIRLHHALELIEAKTVDLGEEVERETLKTIFESGMSVRQTRVYLARLRRTVSGGSELAPPAIEDRPTYLKEYAGGFAINARIDLARGAFDFDGVEASLDLARRRLRQLRKQHQEASPKQDAE
jgi:ParB/RepB/Spo0J family partition protein